MKKILQYIYYGIIEGIVTIIVLFAFLSLIGCKSQIKYVPVKSLNIETVTLRDTIIKTILVPYFDTIYIQNDTVSHLKNQYAESWAKWIGGGLSHSLRIFQDSIPVRVVYKDIERIKETEIPIEVERKLTKWESFKMEYGGWSFGVSCCLLVVGILFIVIWLIRRKV